MSQTSSFQHALGSVIDKLGGWYHTLVNMLPNIVLVIIVAVVVWFLSRGVARVSRRGLERVMTHEHVARLLARLASLAVLFFGVVLMLGILHLDKAVASLLAGVGILGLAVGFAGQDLAANFMAGLLLTFRHPFGTGDLIQSGDFFGRVEEIDLRSTTGLTLQGQRVTIPNKTVLGNPIINYSITGRRRVDLSCGVAYGDDLQKVEEVAVRAVETLQDRDPEQPVELFYEEFGSSSINFTIRFWISPEQRTFLAARSEAIKAIKRAFDEAGITIPFPIRTLDFGVVGGEPLAEHLRSLDLASRGDRA